MCRILGYLGSPLKLEKILSQPEHSLIVQSYQPQEMISATVNADGFGIGWYHPNQDTTTPFTYKNILPIWSDINLPHLSRYIESGCVLGYVRSATAGLAVDFSNCQPFSQEKLLFLHNGFIHNFRHSLYRQIRNCLNDYSYELIDGNTDSEHIFALIINHLQLNPEMSLETALDKTLHQLNELASHPKVLFSANVLISTGKKLVASRYANRSPAPSLYWLKNDPHYPDAVIIASEPLFAGNWKSCPEQSLIIVEENLEVTIHQL